MDLSADLELRLRKIFRVFNKFMLALWRLGLARYGNPTQLGGAIMVIKHTGRKSGLTRYAPVNYFEEGEFVYCTAGFGEQTHWYRNILDKPDVELWLPNSRWSGIAEDISDSEHRISLLRAVLVASGLAGLLFGVNPRKLSDDDLEDLLDHYRLVQIRKISPVTGPGGPGDLAWIWPLSTFLLLFALFRRKRDHSR
jgi:deazaflavin-dependent oxidoreductase (nitroreductase family)